MNQRAVPTMRGWLAACITVAIITRAASAANAQAGAPADDTAPAVIDQDGEHEVGGDAPRWNALSRFYGIVRGLGWQVETPSELDLSSLALGDILVLVAPTPTLDAGEILAFVEAGGALIIADEAIDSELWQRLGLVAVGEGSIAADAYWQNLGWAPIAGPQQTSPLCEGVAEVVTNHPLAFAPDQRNIIGFQRRLGLVAVGQRGLGSYVAYADASLLINRMLEFSGNARLATNTLRWLARPETSRVIVLSQEFSVSGSLSRVDDQRNPYARSLADLNRWLSDRREWMLTPGAVYVGVGLAIALMTIVSLLALGRRQQPAHARLSASMATNARPPLDPADGPRTAADTVAAAIWLRDELEAVISQRTGVAHALTFEHPAALAAMQARYPAAARALAGAIRLTRRLPARYAALAADQRVTFTPRALRRLLALRTQLFAAMGVKDEP
ncbi:MAG: hypothetical protein IPL79_03910 [Myxococcales bacterium]|nr:hypothetical protein [Myxococcales bacterium]